MEIKCQLDATEVFIADLIACSTCFGHHYAHHQELKSIIQLLLPVVFRVVVFKLLVWCTAEDYVCGLQDTAGYCKPQSSWWWAQWCPKHVEQAIRSAIKTSVASSWHFISTYLKSFHYNEAISLEFLHCWHSAVLASTVCVLHTEEHDETWFYIKRNVLMTL